MFEKVLKANAIYAIGSVSHSAAFLLLVPYLINSLTPTEFGIWSLLEVSIFILSLSISIGLDIGLMREYWYMDNEVQRARLAGTVFIAMLMWGSILMILVAGVALRPLENFLHTTPRILLLATLAAFFETLFALTLTLFRIREEPIKYVILSLGRMATFVTSSIALVGIGCGLEGAVTGRALAGFVALVAGFMLTRSYISLEFDWSFLKRVATYGLPLLPTNLAGFILLGSDRYFLQFYTTAAVVGIYSFSYKLVSVFNVMLHRPFALDWAPRRFKIATLHDAPRQYADVLLVYFFVGTLFILVILAVAPVIYEWIAPVDYWEGLDVLPLLLLAALIYGLSYPLTVGIVIKDRTSYAAVVGFFAALLCLGLNFWMVPRFGMEGAAWATLLSYISWTCGMAVVSLRLYPIPYPPIDLLVICTAGIFGYLGLTWLVHLGEGDLSSICMILIRLSWLLLVFGVVGRVLLKRTFHRGEDGITSRGIKTKQG